MKIDFEFLEKMVEAGASGTVIIAYLKDQHAKGEKRREADILRKRSGILRKTSGNVRKRSGNVNVSAEANWEQILTTYKRTSLWSRNAGPDPQSPACRCPRELLVQFGIPFATEGSA